MSQYRYGKRNTSANAPTVIKRVVPRLSHAAVSEEVANIRESINSINEVLAVIAELSDQVQDELEGLEASLENLEEQL